MKYVKHLLPLWSSWVQGLSASFLIQSLKKSNLFSVLRFCIIPLTFGFSYCFLKTYRGFQGNEHPTASWYRIQSTNCGHGEASWDGLNCKGTHNHCLLLMLWQVITSGGITFRDQLWHKECFLCSGCRKELCEEAFMSRDDFPFCLDCYNHLYAKKCAACTKPITGKCFILPWFYHDATETMENAT